MSKKTQTFLIDGSAVSKRQALEWADAHFDTVCYFDSNRSEHYDYRSYECLIAAGRMDSLQLNCGNAFEQLKDFYEAKKDWLFGFLGYDLKNEIEQLESKNHDGLQFPDLYFFQPEYVFASLTPAPSPKERGVRTASLFQNAINHNFWNTPIHGSDQKHSLISLPRQGGEGRDGTWRISKPTYLQTIQKIHHHIQRGDIYEMNFCREFIAEHAAIHPLDTFRRLNELSKAPFSCFLKFDGKYLLSASPERFLKKEENKLISMPIKGTARRGENALEDTAILHKFSRDQKERSENVMIVDLVRNDLSRSCVPGSVKVKELFGIKTFPQVHQMVSTITGELRDDVHFIDAIKNAFPMGSMTGAPKVRAMELIEQYEKSKRGLYSGAAGYITPDGDFDFNVVIRSLLYNSINQYLSFQVGSAIVFDSVPEKEYEECLLKAKVIRKILMEKETSTTI